MIPIASTKIVLPHTLSIYIVRVRAHVCEWKKYSTLAYETVRKGYSERRSSYRKKRKEVKAVCTRIHRHKTTSCNGLEKCMHTQTDTNYKIELTIRV